jgi:citrate lyase beta subunit
MHSRSTALHLLELRVLVGPDAGAAFGRIMPTRPIIELVLDADERRGDLNQQRLVGLELAGDDLLQALGLALHAGAQLAQAEHAQGVADLAQQLDLRASSCGWPAPRRTKMSSTSLTLERSSRMAAATVCMSFTLGAERFSRSCSMLSSTGSSSDRAERGAHRGDPRAGGLGAADVIQQVVEELDGGDCV